MPDDSREAVIAKYTDKSRYKPEYIYGDIYVDDRRVEQSNKSNQAKDDFTRELEAAKRFSKHFNCEIFLLPEGDENGNAIYAEKHKNPDSIIKGVFIDFKQARGTDTSIVHQFGRGLRQADGVIITVGDGTSISKAVIWINGKLKSLEKSHDGFVVIIEDDKGNYGTYSINAKRLSAEENPFTTAQGLSSPNPESTNSQVNSNIPRHR